MSVCRLCLGMFRSKNRHAMYCPNCVSPRMIQFDKRLKSTLKEYERHGWQKKLQDAVAGSEKPQR